VNVSKIANNLNTMGDDSTEARCNSRLITVLVQHANDKDDSWMVWIEAYRQLPHRRLPLVNTATWSATKVNFLYWYECHPCQSVTQFVDTDCLALCRQKWWLVGLITVYHATVAAELFVIRRCCIIRVHSVIVLMRQTISHTTISDLYCSTTCCI